MKMVKKITPEEIRVLVDAFKIIGDPKDRNRDQAMVQVAEAIELPIRKTVLSGDIVTNIFERMNYEPGQNPEFTVDFLTPGDEAEFYAYVMPGEGQLPSRRVESTRLFVPTYNLGNRIECSLKYLRDGNWPIIQRMLEVLEFGFAKKMSDDGWQTIIRAGLDRNILINDPNASAGQFTPRLVTLLSSFMRRNGGGNAASVGRSKLTDLYVSPEAHMDIRAWGLDLIPDQVRTNIYYAQENSQDLINIFGVNVHAYDEFGEGQDYQNFYTNTLGASMAGTDVEIAVGLDRSRNDSFVMPVKQDIEITEDNTLHRQFRFGMYGWAEVGFAVLDTRRVLLASL